MALFEHAVVGLLLLVQRNRLFEKRYALFQSVAFRCKGGCGPDGRAEDEAGHQHIWSIESKRLTHLEPLASSLAIGVSATSCRMGFSLLRPSRMSVQGSIRADVGIALDGETAVG